MKEEDLKEIEQPQTLDGCFVYLNKNLKDKTEFKATHEKNILGMTHFTMGIWMRNNWYLWWHPKAAKENAQSNYPQEKPALVKFFNDELNIHHADDMSSIIILSYHRHLHGKDLELDKQTKRYHDHWLKTINEEHENDSKTEDEG